MIFFQEHLATKTRPFIPVLEEFSTSDAIFSSFLFASFVNIVYNFYIIVRSDSYCSIMADSDSDTDMYWSSDSQSDFEGFTEADIPQGVGPCRDTAATSASAMPSSDESDSSIDEVRYRHL